MVGEKGRKFFSFLKVSRLSENDLLLLNLKNLFSKKNYRFRGRKEGKMIFSLSSKYCWLVFLKKLFFLFAIFLVFRKKVIREKLKMSRESRIGTVCDNNSI